MSRPAPVLEPPRRTPKLPIGPGGPRIATGDGSSSAAARPPASAASIAVWLLVGAVTILFAAITSSLLARRVEADWRPGPLPAVLWLGTMVLVASSLTMEWARARGRREHLDQLWAGLVATSTLGAAFLMLQWTAWRQLAAMGVYLSTNPHSAFFFLLTGLHGLHLAGGLVALAYALGRTRRAPSAAAALRTVDPAAVYWHFLTVLWLYLFAILFAL
jgi:cytochrome c oxidase subunit 3